MTMTIDERIERLKALNLRANPEKEVRELLTKIGKLGHVMVTFHKGKPILRARPNNGGERFEILSDYSFKPQEFNTTYQRASTPYRTMFYGCITPENVGTGELNNSRITGAIEAMPWLRDKTTSGYKKISFGKWVVEEDINLLALVHSNVYYGASSYTKELADAYEKFMSIQDKEILENSKKFQQFLANEFSKEIGTHLDYMISATFTDIVTKYPGQQIDGVLYPSVRTSGQGFNIAITPEACSKLGLYAAGECSVYKLKDHTVVGVDRIVELDGKTEKFELTELPSDQRACLDQLGVSSIDDLK